MSDSNLTLEQLVRAFDGAPEVRALFRMGTARTEGADRFPEVELWLVATPQFGALLPTWSGLPANPALCLATADGSRLGCRLVTADGLAVTIHVAQAVSMLPTGLQTIFNRTAAEPAGRTSENGSGDPGKPGRSLTDAPPQFWDALYRAAGCIGRGAPLSAHAALEECRELLIDLYRLALAPGAAATGWHGAERVPGLLRMVEAQKEWLVSPLEAAAQLHCANRLAATYESLMLPLCERLGLPYPFAIRNLAFGRLAEVRRLQEREQSAGANASPSTTAAPSGPAKFRIRRR